MSVEVTRREKKAESAHLVRDKQRADIKNRARESAGKQPREPETRFNEIRLRQFLQAGTMEMR